MVAKLPSVLQEANDNFRDNSVDYRDYVKATIVSTLTLDHAMLTNTILSAIRAERAAQKRSGSAGASASSGGNQTPSKKGKTPTASSSASATPRVPPTLDWTRSPIDPRDFPAGKRPCFSWLCGKGSCANEANCRRKFKYPHEFPAEQNANKESFNKWLIDESGYSFK